MAEYKQVDLQIGTEAQFEEKKSSLPVGTLVGITDPIHKSELDSDLQTTISDVANKLNKPSGTPTADSVVKISSTGTPTYKPVSDFVDVSSVQTITGRKVFKDVVKIRDETKEFITNYYADSIEYEDDGGNIVNTLYFPKNGLNFEGETIFTRPNDLPTEESLVTMNSSGIPTWQSAAPILQDYVDDALLGG